MIIILSNAFKAFFRDTKLTDWLTTAFTAALAVFTWSLAHIASKQTEILSRTDEALHLAASAQSASAQTAERLREITSTQLSVMQGELDEMRSPHAERAYLFIAHDDSTAPSLEGITPGAVQKVQFKNYGKTPALYRGIHARCSYWQTQFPTPNFLPDKWEPGVVVGVNEPIGPFDCPITASADEIARASRGDGYIFMIVKIDY